jgi:hypothetical protein
MKIRRFVTAEQTDGSVLVRVDDAIPDTDAAEPATVIWGWDAVPALPVGPEGIGPEHVDRALFPATAGGGTLNMIVFPPASVMEANEGAHQHATDSVDFAIVLEGEVCLKHPGAGEVTLGPGDVFVQNGAVHEWVNRSEQRCVMACVMLAAARAAG